MVEEVDIWRSAAIFIRQHGREAVVLAPMQADACREAGDFEGKAMWLRVNAAIRELQRTDLPVGGITH